MSAIPWIFAAIRDGWNPTFDKTMNAAGHVAIPALIAAAGWHHQAWRARITIVVR